MLSKVSRNTRGRFDGVVTGVDISLLMEKVSKTTSIVVKEVAEVKVCGFH